MNKRINIKQIPQQISSIFTILISRLRTIGGLAIFILIHLACPEPPTTPPKRTTTINLEVLSTFTTTARLHILVEDTTAEWTFGLIRNGEDVLTATVYNSDTTFTDNGLNPGSQYTYQAQWLEDGIAVDSSIIVTAQTMDTTSHNFVWEIETLGGSGSYLNDVAIVDEDDIWVVGSIETNSGEYNAAHWNGDEWELLEIYSNTLDLYSIQYFADDDIWVSSHCFPYHWNGINWTQYHLNNMGMEGICAGNAILGLSSSELYFVGDNGSMVHYDGTNFNKIESGTDFNFNDMWGNQSITDNEITIILTAKSGNYEPHDSEVHILSNNNVSPLPDVGLPTSISGVWFNENETMYVVGAGVFTFNHDSLFWDQITDYPYGAYLYDVIGPENDLFIVGAYGRISHFNGLSWYHYNSSDGAGYIYGNYFTVNREDNLIAACGWMSEGGVIIRGYSN